MLWFSLSRGACQKLALRWRLRCFAEDAAAKCRKSSQGTCFGGLLGHTRRAACQCNGTLGVIDDETHLPVDLSLMLSPPLNSLLLRRVWHCTRVRWCPFDGTKQKRCPRAYNIVCPGEVNEMVDLPFSSRPNGGGTVSMRLECAFGYDRS